jgi:polysaccharide deacetylase family protein (PEP-CTERM system associated)
MVNVFTVDLEDYFHPTEVNRGIGDWSDFAPRLGIGTSALLDLLAEHNVRATFFVLGWVAKTQPLLVRKIAEAGHEIGCHSYKHQLVFNLTPREFREDTIRASGSIEDACGVVPKVYRAPSYSIVTDSLWALDVLADLGFTHDSSICPIVHDRYGIPGFPRHAHAIGTKAGPIMEVPIATVQLSPKQVAPVGGGAYLRLFPYRYTATGIREINNVEGQPACVYTHPWELDPNQPRVANGVISRLRTYTGLGGMRRKLNRLLTDFEFSTMSAVHPAGSSSQRVESRLASNVVSV